MRREKVLGMFILLATIPLVLLHAQRVQSTTAPRFSIAINAPSAEAKAGSELNVKLVLTNLSDKDLLIYTSGLGERDYTVRVVDKDGQEPLETRYLRALRGKDTSDPISKTDLVIVGGGGLHGVRPGESFELTVDLNKLYVLKPGKYSVQVERLDDESKALVKSNKITVTVTPWPT
jgi:hypothetical protein